jgi:hypothetical protein
MLETITKDSGKKVFAKFNLTRFNDDQHNLDHLIDLLLVA